MFEVKTIDGRKVMLAPGESIACTKGGVCLGMLVYLTGKEMEAYQLLLEVRQEAVRGALDRMREPEPFIVEKI